MPEPISLSRERRGGLDVRVFEQARRLGVDAFVTTRAGGVSTGRYASLNLGDHVGDDRDRVRENRRRVARAAGVAASHLAIVTQVHGSGVADLATPSDIEGAADALVTSSVDLALCVLVADCVPVLVVDPRRERVAVVHAGWRGLVAGVVAATLGRLAPLEDLHAFVGPSISAERYQVGPEVAEHFVDVPGALRADLGDRSLLDLSRVVEHQLVAGGVDASRVWLCDERTDDVTTYFSDRAERPCGRFALVARRHLASTIVSGP